MKSYIFSLILLFLYFQIIHSEIQQNGIDSLLRLSNELIYKNPKQSAFYAQKAFGIAEKDQNAIKQVQSLISYGIANQLQGDFDLSIKTYYEALDILESKDKSLEALINLRLSIAYCTLRDFTKSFELTDQATALYKSLGDSCGIATCYNARGIIHCNLNEYTTAEQFFKNAAQINRKLKDWKALAANINNLGLYKGNSQEKIAYLQEAILINKKLNAIWALGENYNNLGRQYFFANRYDEAIKALITAQRYASEIGAKELICDNYEYKSEVYAAQKNYALAFENLQKRQDMQLTLQSDKNLRNIERSVSGRRLEFQKKEHILQAQAYEIELLNRNMVILCIVMGSLVIISFLGIKWFRRKKNLLLMEALCKLEQSQRELAELKINQQEVELSDMKGELNQNRQELTNFAMYLKSRNELLDKIREQVKEGYKLEPVELGKHLKKINTFISQSQNCDKGTNAMLESIELKNKDYIKRLLQLHPDLTQGERNLATLLRVDLSTKEIALLTGSLPKSINMNRYRLRKHLNLKPEEDLIIYLQSI